MRTSDTSRDAFQALRRVERQQVIVERLHAVRAPVSLGVLAADLAVSERTVARDVERLRDSGVPIDSVRGRGGGVMITRRFVARDVRLDLPEVAALLSSLAVLGPTVSASASSAMRKLVATLDA